MLPLLSLPVVGSVQPARLDGPCKAALHTKEGQQQTRYFSIRFVCMHGILSPVIEYKVTPACLNSENALPSKVPHGSLQRAIPGCSFLAWMKCSVSLFRCLLRYVTLPSVIWNLCITVNPSNLHCKELPLFWVQKTSLDGVVVRSKRGSYQCGRENTCPPLVSTSQTPGPFRYRSPSNHEGKAPSTSHRLGSSTSTEVPVRPQANGGKSASAGAVTDPSLASCFAVLGRPTALRPSSVNNCRGGSGRLGIVVRGRTDGCTWTIL